MADAPDIEALVGELRGLAGSIFLKALAHTFNDAADALERQQAVVVVAQRYTKHYDAHNWPKAMKAITALRVAVRKLAALDAPPEGKG